MLRQVTVPLLFVSALANSGPGVSTLIIFQVPQRFRSWQNPSKWAWKRIGQPAAIVITYPHRTIVYILVRSLIHISFTDPQPEFSWSKMTKPPVITNSFSRPKWRWVQPYRSLCRSTEPPLQEEDPENQYQLIIHIWYNNQGSLSAKLFRSCLFFLVKWLFFAIATHCRISVWNAK